jgi:TonB family protein
MWFNPAIWFLRKELMATHEFLADQTSSEEIGLRNYSDTLLRLSLNGSQSILGSTVNTFSNTSLTKTRFDMMNSNRSSRSRLMRYAIIFPALLGVMMLSGVGGNEVHAQEKTDKTVHEKVEQMPEYPGGHEGLIRYMIENIKYPKDAESAGVEGKVMVGFVVDVDGSVISVNAKNSVYPSLDNQAIQVVSSMPTWKPGMQDGKPVKVEMVLPIAYMLDSKKPNPPVPPMPPTPPVPPAH